DLPEYRLPARHGALGRGAAARSALADAAEGEPAPRHLLRLPQRRSETDLQGLALRWAGARGSIRPAAGDPLLQAEWRLARQQARRAGPYRGPGALRLQKREMDHARAPVEPRRGERYLCGRQ